MPNTAHVDNDGLASVEELRLHTVQGADMDEHEHDEADEIHKELDWNQDGFVTKKEYEKLMMSSLGEEVADAKRADPHAFKGVPGLDDHMIDEHDLVGDDHTMDNYFDDEDGEGGEDL